MIIAFDIETSGLDPDVHQVLEIGAVAYDPEVGVVSQFECAVYHPVLKGDSVAIQMAAASGLLAVENRVHPAVAEDHFEEWLLDISPGGLFYAMGFNVGSFDLQWKVDQTKFADYFHHRTIELGSLLMNFLQTDAPVSSREAAEELFPRYTVKHRALEDAHFAVECFKATRTS